jgi:anti-sigma factor RsiW
MDPQNPPERRAFESPLLGDPPAPADRNRRRERGRNTGWAMLLAVVLLAAIVVL